MLSRSQEKLLRYLGGFPDALSQAWDVPREVSLPGLSDAMGVVRSGLNQPLKALLDAAYISVRVAHVIGGGARRRQVYHITESGRRWLHEHPEEATKASTATAPKAPPTTALVGRQAELETLTNLLEEHGHALVGGLSGVGKTTLLRAWAARQEMDVRWATVDQLSDAAALVAQWTNGSEPIPEDLEAMVEHLDVSCPTVLVVDDVHRVDPRHQSTVADLLDGLLGRGHRLLLGGRLPVPDRFDWPLLRLGTLPAEEAATLLGEHLDEVT
ncbi:MAG: AAA family ATPase, partial [Candidatus Thermoplasmatota archaeon]|nr:AAA family ATPase [Candidatus Thermoplasmatota archaeon]